jgi:Di-haem oxidoreductase, putative peroxidase
VLTAFVRALPEPGRRAGVRVTGHVSKGKTRFATIGCTSCHTPTLGTVESLYSDLLLRDMGDELDDSGSYGIRLPSPDEMSEPDGLPPAFPSGLEAFAGPNGSDLPRDVSGGPRRSGVSATRPLTSTTAGPRPTSRRSRCTVARASERPTPTSGSRKLRGPNCSRSSNPWLRLVGTRRPPAAVAPSDAQRC